MEEIRQLKPNEIDESLTLSAYAFQYELTEADREKAHNDIILEQHWGSFEQDKLAAKMRLIPMQIWLQGRTHKMGGIASVATWPEYRRQGHVGKLLSHALHLMKEQGYTISMLHPFSFAFYHKYGWETSTEFKEYRLESAQLPSIRRPIQGRIERIEAHTGDWKLFNKIYEAYASRYNGMVVRNEAWWRQMVYVKKKGSRVVYYNPSGDLLTIMIPWLIRLPLVLRRMIS
jgi:predicted acetyltransferase